MPLVPMPLSSPTMRLATQVPWPSVSDFEQSCSGPVPPPKMAVSRLHGIVLSTNSTLSRSSGCDGSMPESITATLIPAPLVVFQAWRTPSRSSSHCRTPGAFSPLKASKSCSGSGWKALVLLTRSSQAALTPFWSLILAEKPEPVGTTASASIADRSVTTSAPAFAAASRIAAGEVPFAKRMTWIPRLLPRGSDFADAADGSAAQATVTSATERRPLRADGASMCVETLLIRPPTPRGDACLAAM